MLSHFLFLSLSLRFVYGRHTNTLHSRVYSTGAYLDWIGLEKLVLHSSFIVLFCFPLLISVSSASFLFLRGGSSMEERTEGKISSHQHTQGMVHKNGGFGYFDLNWVGWSGKSEARLSDSLGIFERIPL